MGFIKPNIGIYPRFTLWIIGFIDSLGNSDDIYNYL